MFALKSTDEIEIEENSKIGACNLVSFANLKFQGSAHRVLSFTSQFIILTLTRCIALCIYGEVKLTLTTFHFSEKNKWRHALIQQ